MDEPIMMATMKQAKTMPNGGFDGIITVINNSESLTETYTIKETSN